MNNRFITILTLISSSAFFITSCDSDNSVFQSSAGTAANSGTVSQKNFSILTADVAPGVIDASTGIFTKTSVELTVTIGDRNNQILTDSHTINFMAEYGLVEPSCVTEDGECSVTWTAIKRPEPGGPGDDGRVTITAYTIGEEGFTDTNGNSIFDDGDGTTFDDLEEPFVDTNENFVFNTGDLLIDVVSTNDPSGKNLIHDAADGFFNGSGCQHTSLCGDRNTITIFDSVSMSLVNGVASRTIGGTVTGLAGLGLVLQNNGGDDLDIVVNGSFTFATPIDDGLTYNVTPSTQPSSPTQTCTVANAAGNVSANVTNVDVTCATNTFTIGGTVIGLPLNDTITVVNNNDSINLVIDGGAGSIPYTFVDSVADLGPYSVVITVSPTTGGLTCAFVPPASASGNVGGANITDANIVCM